MTISCASANVPELSALAGSEVVLAQVARAAVVATAWRAESKWHSALGAAGHLAQGVPATIDTVFDLASITKPFLAATVVRLAKLGAISLDTALGEWLPEARATPSHNATFELLLSHRAGLEPHVGLFTRARRGFPVRRAALLAVAARARRQDCRGDMPLAGFPPLYSDLGYLLTGEALVSALQRSLDVLIAEQVSRPLGLELGSAARWQRSSAEGTDHVAPTEILPGTSQPLHCRVHDENAWTLGGHGVSGHAGLFGPARSVLRFGAELVDALAGRSAWLGADSARCLIERRPGGSSGMGLDGKATLGSSAGPSLSPSAFGHLGFTGTSFWCDPHREVVVVLLTNRVCPTRENQRIRGARPRIHEALFHYALTQAGL